MKALGGTAALPNLREQPLWRLLAADKAPVVIALLQSLLFEDDKTLLSSALHERLAHGLDQLRAIGEDMPQPAQAYVADWLKQGWLKDTLVFADRVVMEARDMKQPPSTRAC
ncbi:DUF3375 family protein [Rhodoferax sediminis]|uniref:DUF3375 family protein n=1 Tax=Rhodoferax sediminis TaxID=2509614 RepID=A0A515DDP6_9BURK|nr:DUF3375 family protein [Rhodoferax sediminis]QDL38536.1 DUF3375 family protein [Rhodoferax sediminis]